MRRGTSSQLELTLYRTCGDNLQQSLGSQTASQDSVVPSRFDVTAVTRQPLVLSCTYSQANLVLLGLDCGPTCLSACDGSNQAVQASLASDVGCFRPTEASRKHQAALGEFAGLREHLWSSPLQLLDSSAHQTSFA